MARKSDGGAQVAQQLLAAFQKLPTKAKVAVGVLAVIVVGALYVASRKPQEPPPAGPASDPPPDPSALVNVPPPAAAFPAGTRDVVFCTWNMENLFDDKDDRRRPPDADYDRWFVEKPEDRQKHYDKLATWLLKQNGGNGPDVVVGIEIESLRAAELLRQALNANLPAGATPYPHVAMQEVSLGRHIAPCVVSRYPLSGAKLLGRGLRILAVRVAVNGHELLLVASHWTSQLSDDGSEGRRDAYATTIHEEYAAAVRANPKLDFLVCGDFNDPPESDSVYKSLHLMGDSRLVTANANPPRLFGLLSGRPPEEFGTYYYSKPLIYDHVGVSPGMFDASGWGYDPASVRVPTDGLIRFGTRGRRPWRFGNAKDDALGRGFSDHFPVMVTLKVAP